MDENSCLGGQQYLGTNREPLFPEAGKENGEKLNWTSTFTRGERFNWLDLKQLMLLQISPRP